MGITTVVREEGITTVVREEGITHVNQGRRGTP